MSRDFLVCRPRQGRARRLSPALVEALPRAGCTLRARAGRLALFAGSNLRHSAQLSGEGWVLGDLFVGANQAPDRLAVAAGDPSLLIERHWGAYVLVADGLNGFHALRDPSGGLPSYFADIDGDLFITSIPGLLFDCGLVRPSIDWPEVGRSLARRSVRPARTAIAGIDELLPGHSLRLAEGRPQQERSWDPWRSASSDPPADPARALGATISRTVQTWMWQSNHPLVEISGGLDSAVVAAAVAAAAHRASLITFAAAPGDPDETPYARAIAERLSLPLEIARPRIEDVDIRRSLCRDLPRPNARSFTQAADLHSLIHARSIGADLFVSGGGGDDVFAYLRTVLPAIDRLREDGISAMLDTARDIAVMNHSTYWEALAKIVRRLVRGRSSLSPLDLRFLSPEIARLPGIKGAARSDERKPGKAAHVQGILSIHNYLEGHERTRHAPILSPLLSQPVVERCLSIPTWHWCAGGRNRAVARDAFRDRLPSLVIERRSKGRFDGFCAALLAANRELVRSMLLDGAAASHGLFDRQAVEKALDEPLPSGETAARLLVLADVESWASAWQSRPVYRR